MQEQVDGVAGVDGAGATAAVAAPEPPAAAGPTGSGPSPVTWVVLAGVAVALAWSYAPNIAALVRTWNHDPDYSHGFLVVPVALAIFWRRGESWATARTSPSWTGWVVVAGALAARAAFYELGKNWLETFTLLPAVAGLVLALGGWRLLGRAWPAVLYLLFMLPLPPGVDAFLSQPLQRVAARGSCGLLKFTGRWVLAEGNVIDIGASRLEVATACNGLSMLMCLSGTVAAMVLLVPMSTWKRVALLASILPVALASNILRITATAWCYDWLGPSRGAEFAHDAAGWLMMPTALALVALELALLSWLVIEEDVDEKRAGNALLIGLVGSGPSARTRRGGKT